MLWLVGGYKGRSNRYQSIYMHNDNTKEHIARQLILCTMSCFTPRHHTIANIYIYVNFFQSGVYLHACMPWYALHYNSTCIGHLFGDIQLVQFKSQLVEQSTIHVPNLLIPSMPCHIISASFMMIGCMHGCNIIPICIKNHA